MRIRSLKPEFWMDEPLASVSVEAQLLAIGLLNYADDEGYFRANPSLIKGALFPVRFADDSTIVRRALDELSRIGYVRLGTAGDGTAVGVVCTFRDHQKIDRPSPSKYRGVVAFADDSTIVRRALDEPSLLEQGSGIRDRSREQGDARAPVREERPGTDGNGTSVRRHVPTQADLDRVKATLDAENRSRDAELQGHGGAFRPSVLHDPDRDARDGAVAAEMALAAQLKPDESAILSVYQHWLDLAGLPPRCIVPDDLYQGRTFRLLVLERLKDGLTPDDLKRAISACFASERHRQRGVVGWGAILKTLSSVQEFLAIAKASAPKKPAALDVEAEGRRLEERLAERRRQGLVR